MEPVPLGRFARIVHNGRLPEGRALARALRRRLAGRTIWHVNSTAVGGGVAELLQSLLGYARGAGIDTRWLVIRGNAPFFRLTKRLHHALHGSCGDGARLDDEAHRRYRTALRPNGQELAALARPGDFVVLHDPQTAGLAPYLLGRGIHVIWRCHIGHDRRCEEVERGWRFLARYLDGVPNFVFSRRAYVPDQCDSGKAAIIRPSIDAFSPKNEPLPATAVRSVLVHVGLVEGPAPPGPTVFVRADGSVGRVERAAEVIRLGRAPSWETPLVVQVSRWDALKDPIGVMRGFARLVAGGGGDDAELVLAGPRVTAVADDPEAAAVLEQVTAAWRALPEPVRGRVHLATLPTDNVQENATIVNALQRHAAVVVQKSLHEGFGLTVTEAMWKARPLVASAVGGIQDQIEDGVCGVLLHDPTDPDAFAAALAHILGDPDEAARLGHAARERVREHFLGLRHLVEFGRLVERIDEAAPRSERAAG